MSTQIDPLRLQITERLEKKFGLNHVEPIHVKTRVGKAPEFVRTHYQAWLNGRKVFIKHYGNAYTKNEIDNEFRFSNLLHGINANNFLGALFYSDDENYRCIAFEFLEGESLSRKIGRGDLSSSEKEQIIFQLKNVAESLLESGIIHRDLRPGNFIVTKDGMLKLIDFGAAVDGKRFEKSFAASKNPVLLIPILMNKLVGRRYVDDMVRILNVLEAIGHHENYQETYRDCEAYLKEYLKDKPVQHIRRQLGRTNVFHTLRKIERHIKLTIRPFLHRLKQIKRWLGW